MAVGLAGREPPKKQSIYRSSGILTLQPGGVAKL
jgi:hypothetical protein